MVNESCKQNNQLELIIELIEGLFQEEGYKTKRFSETKVHSTTAYDCLILQDVTSREFTITVDETPIEQLRLK